MGMSESASEDLATQAASLAFAMIRFEERAAWPMDPTLERGVADYSFVPGWRGVPIDRVVPLLAGLPSPAWLLQTTVRGHVGVILLEELGEDRKRVMQKELDNQVSGINELSRSLGLTDTSPLLLDVDGDTLVVSLAALRYWGGRFGVNVGWNFGPLEHDSRATGQIHLRRRTGEWSSGPLAGESV